MVNYIQRKSIKAAHPLVKKTFMFSHHHWRTLISSSLMCYHIQDGVMFYKVFTKVKIMDYHAQYKIKSYTVKEVLLRYC